MSSTSNSVGLGQILILESSGILLCPDVGSTVALVAYSGANKIGGIAHVVLPLGNDKAQAARYANLAPESLLDQLAAQGTNLDTVLFAYIGGSQVLHGANGNNWTDLGARNVLALERELKRLRRSAVAYDTGGAYGRSLSLDIATGMVNITTFAKGPHVLCDLSVRKEAA